MGRGGASGGCARVQRRLDDLMDGVLEAGLRDSLLDHISHCAGCAAALAAGERAREVLNRLPRLEGDTALVGRISAAVGRVAGRSERLAQRSLAALPRVRPTPETREAIRAAVAAEASVRGDDCRALGSRVDALLEGSLPAGLALATERHALHCARCGPVLRSARAGRAALSSLPRLAPSQAMRHRIRAEVEALRTPRRRLRQRVAWAGAAVAACLAVAAGLYGSGLGPTGPAPTAALAPAPPPTVAALPPDPEAPAPAPAVPARPEVQTASPPAPTGARVRPSPAPPREQPLWTTRPAEDAPAVATRPEGPVDTYVAPARETIVVAGALPVSGDGAAAPAPTAGFAEPTEISSAHTITLDL